jgi:hypothetical protein
MTTLALNAGRGIWNFIAFIAGFVWWMTKFSFKVYLASLIACSVAIGLWMVIASETPGVEYNEVPQMQID